MAVPKEPAKLSGTIDGLIFESSRDLFKIISVKISQADFDWEGATIIVTGSFGELNLDESYTFSGQLVDHPKYGRQFQADYYQQQRPDTQASLIQYFASDQFPGIGKVSAQKIVQALGTSAIDRILDDAHVLQSVGLSAAQRQTLTTTLQQSHGSEQLMIELGELGFGSKLVNQIVQKYHEQALTVIHDNPYQLIYDIRQVGFKRADQVATKLNMAADAPVRIQAAIIQFLRQELMTSGNTYVKSRRVLAGALDLLVDSCPQTPSEQQLADELVTLASEGKIIVQNDRIYLAPIYHSEFNIAQRLHQLLENQVKAWPQSRFERELKAIERWFKVSYNQQQRLAIQEALNKPVSILTGGPGTGKTTILNAVVTLFARKHHFTLEVDPAESDQFPIQLAAPTGRAAKHLAGTTGLPAQTIHRLLGLNRLDDQFGPAEPQPIHGQLLIIDEMSMVDQQLFEALLQAVPEGMQVLLVGDQDQLPSVGPGRVFADLIAAQVIPVTALTEIYRQSADSTIISLAHAIKKGEIPPDLTANLPDRSFFACLPGQVDHLVSQVVAHAQSHFSISEMQILAPMYRGSAGIDRLNHSIQELLNPKKTPQTKEVQVGKVTYRIGDKVIQLVNDGPKGIYNGDIGFIKGIQEANKKDHQQVKLIVDFAGNEVSLARADWLNIGLAYCVSIHKSQGSEYPLVILPLTLQSRRMLQRKLLYTAVTRAKSKLIIIGQKKAFTQAILDAGTERKTTLTQQLRAQFELKTDHSADSVETAKIKEESALYPSQPSTASKNSSKARQPKEYRLTAALIAQNQIDPLIGMHHLQP